MASVWTPKHTTKNLYRVAYREGGRESKAKLLTGWLPKKEAAEKAAELERQFAKQAEAGREPTAATPITTLLDRWVQSRLAGGHAKAPRVTKVKHVIGGLAKERGWRFLSDITAPSVDAWVIEAAGVKPGMTIDEQAQARMNAKGIRRPLRDLQTILRWAESQDLPIHKGALGVRLGKAKTRQRHDLLTTDQVGRILVRALNVAGFSMATLCEHIALYGCRPVDVCRCDVSDWNSEQRKITYRDPKNGVSFTHRVHEEHAVKLDRCAAGRKPEDPLFVDPWERRWKLDKNDAASQLTSWYIANIGSVVAPGQHGIYDLKRFGMTRLVIAAKGNRKLVITMSGHKTEAMVDTYTMQNDEGQVELIKSVEVVASVPAPALRAPKPAPVRVPLPVDTTMLATPRVDVAVPLATHPKIKRGFAALSPERRREIAQRAYAKALATGKLHRFTSDEGRAAADRGGFKVMDPIRRQVAQSIGGQTARELGAGFDSATGKAARQGQLDSEPIVIEGLDSDEEVAHG